MRTPEKKAPLPQPGAMTPAQQVDALAEAGAGRALRFLVDCLREPGMATGPQVQAAGVLLEHWRARTPAPEG